MVKWMYNKWNAGEKIVNDQKSRKSVRLRDYDYTQAGFYYVTICTEGRRNILGQIINVGADSISARYEMALSGAGRMIEKIYCTMPNEFINIMLHEYIIMPNHLHGIIQIQQAGGESSLPKIIQSFKRQTTLEYIRGVKNNRYPPFNKHIWQRGFYDHIIRNEVELQEIRQYILDNPTKWQEDRYFI